MCFPYYTLGQGTSIPGRKSRFHLILAMCFFKKRTTSPNSVRGILMWKSHLLAVHICRICNSGFKRSTYERMYSSPCLRTDNMSNLINTITQIQKQRWNRAHRRNPDFTGYTLSTSFKSGRTVAILIFQVPGFLCALGKPLYHPITKTKTKTTTAAPTGTTERYISKATGTTEDLLFLSESKRATFQSKNPWGHGFQESWRKQLQLY